MASVINKGVKSILPPLMHSQKVGVVVSAGKMAGAVKVRVAEVEWNKKFRKVNQSLSLPRSH
jgi:small subunit ribosomal protein S17